MILATFHVWVVGSDGKNRRKVGRGDDPNWSPDGFVTRAFPDRDRGGPKIMIETTTGEKELADRASPEELGPIHLEAIKRLSLIGPHRFGVTQVIRHSW